MQKKSYIPYKISFKQSEKADMHIFPQLLVQELNKWADQGTWYAFPGPFTKKLLKSKNRKAKT